MFINNIHIKNFRALEDIQFELTQRVNVIVGPNAIGKTTVLQAIRLTKALLAPRSPNEAFQTLISLGAASPHFPQRAFIRTLARDPQKTVEIKCNYCLTDEEINLIQFAKNTITREVVQSRLGQAFANPTNLIQFLGSLEGQRAQSQALKEIDPAIEKLRVDKTLILGLQLHPVSGQIIPTDPLAGVFLGYLDGQLPPHRTVFSYFPADRALPVGEVPVQLGAADTQQQLESHNSQPQLKYNRLKNTIFNHIVMGVEERQSLIDEFDKIFREILRGRRIDSMGLNEIGLLSVIIEDLDTGSKYEIDNLSSGEKGLLLTFLLIAKSISRGGIVLLDEPELHLNPAVCKDVLRFTLETYAIPRNIQFIVCTHSPEILSGAFTNEECSLFHIISEKLVTRVGHKAIDEYSEALRALGTSVSEGLLYKGTVFVEGDDDVMFLETGFDKIFKRYQVKDRGGRKEVEKTAKKLQELEKKGEKVDPVFLIFDRDELITDIKSSAAVKVLQWKRRCMENYLIDLEVITNLLKKKDIANPPVSNEGEVAILLKNLALSQLDAVAARKIYQDLNYESPSLHVEDVEGKSLEDISEALFARLLSSKASIVFSTKQEWKTDFINKCEQEKNKLAQIWDVKWKEECDGKKLFTDLRQKGLLKVSISSFKRSIVQEMKNVASENWRLVESQLKELLDQQAV
jgi:predicted ATP-dependent endonuclease of OLD family